LPFRHLKTKSGLKTTGKFDNFTGANLFEKVIKKKKKKQWKAVRIAAGTFCS
jgi:hypothetical protein